MQYHRASRCELRDCFVILRLILGVQCHGPSGFAEATQNVLVLCKEDVPSNTLAVNIDLALQDALTGQ